MPGTPSDAKQHAHGGKEQEHADDRKHKDEDCIVHLYAEGYEGLIVRLLDGVSSSRIRCGSLLERRPAPRQLEAVPGGAIPPAAHAAEGGELLGVGVVAVVDQPLGGVHADDLAQN